MKRTSGVLMHISSLWGEYSCGSFGNEAKEFIDFLSSANFGIWQVLPFCMVDECNSPYKSFSAFGGNLYFVDLPTLHKKGYISDEELSCAKQTTPYSCEYQRLYEERFELLRKASLRLCSNERDNVAIFMKEHRHIDDFCRFMALKEANGGKVWSKWTVEEYDNATLFAWQFIQYEFFTQWAHIKKYANSKGIKIIGDIPIYVSYDSADVWANRSLFCLDEDGIMKKVAGVPPDYFSSDGQLWGNPLYNWDEMKKDGYLWWMERLGAMFEMFDGVRIDHFRALESYWAVDAGATTARDGMWIPGPGMDFINKINNIKEDKIIIAEDLGLITDEVRELVEKSGFPGMRVLQFGFLDDSDSTNLPHNYINNCVAYTGTHDNNTLLGYVWEISDDSRRRLLDYCGYTSADWNGGYDHIIRTMFASSAGAVILPIQDLLCYGSDTRLNTPGRAEGNWMYRVTKEQLCTINKEKYVSLNGLYKRNQL